MAGGVCREAGEMEKDKMSLLDEAMTPCTYLNKVKQADGYGGYVTTWTDGAVFDAAIVYDTSLAASVGGIQTTTTNYVVTTRKTMTLEYHDVFRRNSDGKTFRVTSDGLDHHTPASAGLDMRNVTAEEFILTT